MIRSRAFRAVAATVAIATLSLTAACGSAPAEKKATAVDSGKPETLTPGKLTIATGLPAYTPWVMNDKPESGEGFEAELSYDLAEKMGFKKSDVKWVRTTFDSAIAPGAKDWDMNIQQFSITPERKKAVDFSPVYYRPYQAIVVRKDSKYANAKSISELKDAQIGAMVGTISYTLAVKTLKKDIKTFNDNAALAQAVDSNQVDAMVVAVPIASNIVNSGQVKNGKVLGAIPGTEDPEGMAIVLPKNSPVTSKLTKAMNELLKDGTVKKLQDKWLSKYTTGVPMLKK